MLENKENKSKFAEGPKGPIVPEKITARLADIDQALKELTVYSSMTLEEFSANKNNFYLASYWLRIAIEAVLTIGTHILSRAPSNGKEKDYTNVILSLADYQVMPAEFAKKIKGMAGYRNRIVHRYWEVKTEEMWKIIKENIDDFPKFVDFIKVFLKEGI